MLLNPYSDPLSQHINQLVERLELLMPNRIISRDYVEHNQRESEELRTGILTILEDQYFCGDAEWNGSFRLVLAAQIEVEGRNNGGRPFDVAVAENKFAYQLRAALRNLGDDLPFAHVLDITFSGQFSFPHGWFTFNIMYGPIAETSFLPFDDGTGTEGDPNDVLYPPTVNISQMKAIHVDVDSEPHESADEHLKWLNNDYSTSAPEAQIDLELNK